MIPVLLVSIALQGKPDGAALVSKMFAFYSKASSMTGTIRMTQTADGQSITLDTDIAYESPSKLYIKQVLHEPVAPSEGFRPTTWLVTSDGNKFSYDYINDVRMHADKPEPSRLWEPVNGVRGVQTYQDIFLDSIHSLGDVSIPEILAIGGTTGFKTIKDEIATVEVVGPSTVNSTPVTVLKGLWGTSSKLQPTASYEMDITSTGELLRYMQDETVSVQLPGQKMKPQRVITTWDLDLHPDAKPDESLFTVVMQPID